MRLVGAVAVLLRRIRAERGVATLLFVLVAVTSFVVAASPRLFDRVADAGMRYEVARATSAQRNLQFTTVDQIRAEDDDALANVDDRGEGFLERLPDSVGQLIASRSYVVDSTRFGLIDPPNLHVLRDPPATGRRRGAHRVRRGPTARPCTRAGRARPAAPVRSGALERDRRGAPGRAGRRPPGGGRSERPDAAQRLPATHDRGRARGRRAVHGRRPARAVLVR